MLTVAKNEGREKNKKRKEGGHNNLRREDKVLFYS